MSANWNVSASTREFCVDTDTGDLRPLCADLSTDPSDFRESLHELNQRYREAWDRAEQLQDELNDIKSSRAFRILSWWRTLTRPFRLTRHSLTIPDLDVTESLESLRVRAC